MGELVAKDVKIAAVVSLPRWESSLARGIIEKALDPFRIRLNAVGGAYWHHHLQEAMAIYIEDGVDWILTFDADTFVSAKQLDTMMGIFGSHPHIDALVPLQCRRNNDTPLATIKGRGEVQVGAEPVEISTGHFGCTLIRTDALAEVPKPWFWEAAGPDGSWTHPEHIDPDIGFWKGFQKAGRSLYLAPSVKIGHMEEVVSTFDDDMKPVRMFPHKWRERFLGESVYTDDDLAERKGPLKLNIGAGNVRIPGFTAIDRQLGSEAYPLRYADNTVAEIRASHILEHFDAQEAPKALAEWIRVLKPGGRIRVAVPDMDRILSLRQDGDREWYRYIMGGQIDGNDYHRTVWTEQSLGGMMRAVGLEQVEPWTSDNTDMASHPCSVNLEGVKPAARPEGVEPAVPSEKDNDADKAVTAVAR